MSESIPPDTVPATTNNTRMEAFTFGDPTPVLEHSEMLDSFECWLNGRWYEPPISFPGLAKSLNASVHHSSAIYFKTNILTSTFVPNKFLTRDAFKRFALDFLIFGNAYLEKRTSRSGLLLSLAPALAKFVRRGKELNSYYFVTGWQQEHEFAAGSIFHLIDPDINQEVYGVPQYLSALQSAWLNEAATLFRRKYYKNGSHAGFIFYMTDAAQNQTDVDSLRKAMRESKGPGNFRNLFMYAPNGKKDGIQILPVSDVAAKDEFFNIKGVTRDDVLAAHRVPPQLLGIMPNNTGGFGAVEPAARVFARNELVPLQAQFRALNDWLGQDVIQFTDYELSTMPTGVTS
ncbi:phage portal protein [Solimicrobium silvestre]|uniref:Phage portal protein, PBSX family n=1 Tax=Solimicrobium silvestre TaxID=2099400 RepID=A0A2S9GT10_9BURK|nr:phage portal protein [Solimicrobium silvestre]PRC90862.1 Phage portal protein, PBSX family [Solimicrobium silvestre]